MGLDPAVRKFLDTKPDSGDADEAIAARLFDDFGPRASGVGDDYGIAVGEMELADS